VLYTPIVIKMVLAIVLLLALGAGIILGSEKTFHSLPMALLSFLAVACAVGLGYFGSGIIYGRGLEIKRQRSAASINHSANMAAGKQDTTAVKISPGATIREDSALKNQGRAR